MLFRFLILIHVCAAFPLKCPAPSQWSLRARRHCPDPSKYFCLKNDLINGYSENCTVFDFLQPGRKNVIRGGLDADICLSDGYHPWPITFYTNVSTNCIFIKSTCAEEGQVIYGQGNRNIDATCRCDYRRGYDFLVKTVNPCFCVPSKEDCSCYVKTCPNSADKLSPDYKCLHDDENITVSECEPIIYERDANKNKTDRIVTRQNLSNKVQRNMMICSIFIGLNIAFCIGVLIIEFCWQAFFYIVEPSSVIELTEGEDVELMYKLLINIFPISFLKNDQVLPAMVRTTKYNDSRWIQLSIENVTLNDAGDYCMEIAGHRSRLTHLVVRHSCIKEPPSDIQLVEGQSVELGYTLWKDGLPSTFLKNGIFLPALKNIETVVDGVCRKLKITNITQKDVGLYCLEVLGHRSGPTDLIIKPMFTSKIDTQQCTEGDKIELSCSVHTANIEVKWYKKERELHQSNNILITSSGNQHTLTIVETAVKDSETYCVKAENVEMEFSITVKAIFKRRLIDITTMEGIDTKLECKTVEENCHVLWFKDDKEIDSPARMTIERTQGCLHTLSLAPTRLEDSGTYSIKINGATSICKVYVKEMPETIKRMSIQDREEFLKAAKTVTDEKTNSSPHNIEI